MIRILSTDKNLSRNMQHWLYNGLDCCITREISPILQAKLGANTRQTYDFEMALQVPAMAMMLRGFLVDKASKSAAFYEEMDTIFRVEKYLKRLASVVGMNDLNPQSHSQLKRLFYDVLGLPSVNKKSTSQKALKRLSEFHFYAQPFVSAIKAIRESYNLINVFGSQTDSDGRVRFWFSPSATKTGQWSCKKNDGTSALALALSEQAERLRRIFIPDPGWKLAYVTPRQAEAESKVVAYLAEDERYIQAHESADPERGDLHTIVAKMIWPDLNWTGDAAADRQLADAPAYKHFSYRDLAKHCGYATNYGVSAWTLSRNLHIPKSVVEEIQANYFRAFPGIQRWQLRVAEAIQKEGVLVNPFGRVRQFFGRALEDATIREAIAYGPKSTVADALSRGLLAIYWQLDYPDRGVQLLSSQNGAIIFQFRSESALNAALNLLSVPIPTSTVMTIGLDCKCGYNLASASDKNPNGLLPKDSPNELSQTRS